VNLAPKDPAAPTTSAPATSAPAQVSLCVAISRAQANIERGLAATWVVSAWTKGGTVPDATLRLAATPANLTAQFSFGCGSFDGSASCDLGEMVAQSAQRQLQAQVTVPASSTGTSVKLTVIASAAHLSFDPTASAVVAVTAAPTPPNPVVPPPITTTTPLPIGDLPQVNGAGGVSSTLSPGGNAAGLFPTLSPSPSPVPGTQGQQKANAKTVANTAALPLGAPVVGAQLVGLSVLALAFVLAVTRMSIRRRPASASGWQPLSGAAPSGADKPPAGGDTGKAPDSKDAGSTPGDKN
jgi:hypothetical protein